MKSKSKHIVIVGYLNKLYWLEGRAILLDGRSFFFRRDQAEILRSLWGHKVQIILDTETNYLQQIEEVKEE